MTRNVRGGSEFSAWTGGDIESPVRLVPVKPPSRLEANGAPIVELSHEHVIASRARQAGGERP